MVVPVAVLARVMVAMPMMVPVMVIIAMMAMVMLPGRVVVARAHAVSFRAAQAEGLG